MKKVFLTLFAVIGMALIAIAQESKMTVDEEGVIINGVKWATRNVATPGTFAAKPEDPGMFYQWNRKKAWPATGDVIGWDSSIPIGNTWEKVNDPSPVGWRVPTFNEIKTLLDNNKVSNEWTTKNGIRGIKFIDKATNNTLFLPAVSIRYYSDGTLYYTGSNSDYWSSTQNGSFNAYSLSFFSRNANWWGSDARSNGFSIRSVAD